jgi:hypothetical protein
VLTRLLGYEPPEHAKRGETVAERWARMKPKPEPTRGQPVPVPASSVPPEITPDVPGPVVYFFGDDEPTVETIPGPWEPVAESARITARILAPEPEPLPVKDLSNSEVSSWLRCRRQWWLAYYRKLARRYTNWTGPLAIGTRIHKALAAWYVPEGQERTDPREALERAIVEDWTALVAEHGSMSEEESEGLSAKFQEAVNLERIMLSGYMQHMEETGLDAGLVIVAPETALAYDEKVTVDGVDYLVRLIALLDVRARLSTGDNAVRVFIDHKSLASIDPKLLKMDTQMLHYFLLEALNTEAGQARCDAALYNILRKVKRTGAAKPPFYDRIPIYHNDTEIENYHKRVIGTASDIIRTTRALDNGADPMTVVYPSPLRPDCQWCQFFDVCSMFDGGERAEDYLREWFTEVDPMARYRDSGVL